MPIQVQQVVTGHGAIKEPHFHPSPFQPNSLIQAIASEPQSHGVFKAVNRTSVGTTTIAEPNDLGAIIVTDIIISAKKAANSDVTIQFSDSSNTIILFLADSINSDFNLTIPLVGLFRGWQDADLELVTTGSVIATVTCGYMKVPNGLPFAEWDALR